MIDLQSIKNFTIAPPRLNIIGTAEEFDALPDTHKAQIIFLNKDAEHCIFEFTSNAHMVTGGFWDPFVKGNFKSVEVFDRFFGIRASKQDLKKWLFKRGIAFPTWVFVLLAADEPVMLMTWKMMMAYVEYIFFGDDAMVYDQTLHWCLVYHHENKMFFGKDKIYDPTEDEQQLKDLNERKKRYPQFKHPFL